MRSWSPWVAGLVAALSGGACKARVDTAGFEDNIRQRTREMGLSATQVVCPKDVEAKPGNVFTCQVELDGKKTYALDVTVKTVDAATRKAQFDTAWHDGPAVQVKKLVPLLESDLGKTFGAPITLACGDEPLRFLDAQRKTRCALTAGTVKSTATIDFNEALTPTDWHLDPPLLARAKLEAVLTPAVREKTGPDVKVDCGPDALLLRPPEGVVWCSIADTANHAKIKVEIDDKLNVQRWEVATPPG